MLTCVFHPTDGMRVVELNDATDLMASGFWFDSPAKAVDYKIKIQDKIKNEKVKKPKQEKSHEK